MNVGSRLSIRIAGVDVDIEPRLEGLSFRLNDYYEAFQANSARCDLRIRVETGSLADRLAEADSYLFKCSTWGVQRSSDRHVFEAYHPVFARLVARAEADADFREFDLRFNDTFLNWFCARYGLPKQEVMTLSHPLEQVLFLPVLARHDAVLSHACGAVLDGRAFVFAGHSGDGKTTLSRILAEEGLELLSDERVAIRRMGDRFTVYGTPWPGDGCVVSPASYPLGGMYVLRKGLGHRLVRRHSSTLAAELLSRCIVPYYLPEETSRIVELVTEITDAVPTGELEFYPSLGIVSLLSRAA